MKILVFTGGTNVDLFLKVDREKQQLFLMSEKTGGEFKEIKSLMIEAGQWGTDKEKFYEELTKNIEVMSDESLKVYLEAQMSMLGLTFKGMVTEENLAKVMGGD